MEIDHTTPKRRKYITPQINKMMLDAEISILMMSELPPTPGWGQGTLLAEPKENDVFLF